MLPLIPKKSGKIHNNHKWATVILPWYKRKNPTSKCELFFTVFYMQ